MDPVTTSQPLIVDVVVVARNRGSALASLLARLPRRHLRSVVVVDNGSTDGTAQVARDAGAVVLRESRPGYGTACLRAIAHLEALPVLPDAVVFLASDGSDDPGEIPALVEPIRRDNAELVIGVRQGAGARRHHVRAVIGLLGAVYRHRFDDVGPFRAIRFPALIALALRDRGGGFHVEMLVKAIKFGLHIVEVPVRTPDRGERASRGRKERSVARNLGTTGRVLFHIVRHVTLR